jgi:hypothetical protein
MKKMPQWLKVVVIVVVVGFGVLFIAGVAGAVALIRTIEKMEKASEQARVDGEIAGINGTGEGCVEAAVRRSAECEGLRFLCMPQVDTFLYGCLDEAPVDFEFCKETPTSKDVDAVQEWSRNVCAQQGQEDDVACTLGLTAANVYCAQQKDP